jgi:hypothetical protein
MLGESVQVEARENGDRTSDAAAGTVSPYVSKCMKASSDASHRVVEGSPYSVARQAHCGR